jgi:uncharacterized protein
VSFRASIQGNWRPIGWHRPVAVLRVLAVIVVLAAVLAYQFSAIERLERRLLYRPSRDMVHPVTTFGANAAEVWFGDHARLHGVFVPRATATSSTGVTVVFFHGNFGNLSHRAPLIAQMTSDLGANVFTFDYQGYGQSSGVPSEAATSADARAAIDYLRTRPDVDPARLVYFGESLGGAVAIQLATEHPPMGLVVQSSFTSVSDMARIHYPALVVLLRWAPYRYDSLTAVRSIRSPLMLIHGEADATVPPSSSQQLLDAATGPKRLLMIPGAGHNDVFKQGGPALWQTLHEFLTSLDRPQS